ncbi:helix-turn-helix domain-containing protein [Flavobacterium chuncheonense]|uniref:Helix-turn-helix domain-containing protein n=1 Tax=Flavobacterium chuncheonense TaxID=2026653 RepID=A0ABW5YI76_9FLAO
MVNTDDFIKRLETIFDYYNLTASSFADKIGVQRSSLSHLLSGRNKPSLDFILKVTEVFPEIDLYWILNGRGNFPSSEEDNIVQNEVSNSMPHPSPVTLKNEFGSNEVLGSLFTEEHFDSSKTSVKPNEAIKNSNMEVLNTPVSNVETDIDYVVIFYSDGTFRKYKPK